MHSIGPNHGGDAATGGGGARFQQRLMPHLPVQRALGLLTYRSCLVMGSLAPPYGALLSAATAAMTD